MRLKRKTEITIGLGLLIVALLVCLYPIISNFTATKYQSIVQTQYNKTVSKLDDTELQKAKEAALEYNKKLIENSTEALMYSENHLKLAADS